MITIGLTDHVEGPRDRPSAAIYEEVADLVRLADRLGVRFAWFSEHHAHAHQGHLPTPLLFALQLASETERIQLGTGIICLNLRHPLEVAETVAVADILAKGRLAPGFGSGSTPEEFSLFGLPITDETERHERFSESLALIQAAWRGDVSGLWKYAQVPPHQPLPIPQASLPERCWVAVNSVGSAKIAGATGFNMLFSHLRTPEQYRQYRAAYQDAGGSGLIAANRPVFVGPTDREAFKQAEPALRTLWRRFRAEGKIPAETPEPKHPQSLCDHPINFLVGSPESVALQIQDLNEQAPFDVLNVEVRWTGLSHETVRNSLQLLMEGVRDFG